MRTAAAVFLGLGAFARVGADDAAAPEAGRPAPVPELRPADLFRARDALQRLTDEDYRVRVAAREDLRALGPGTLPLLAQAAEGHDAEVRTVALELMAEQREALEWWPLNARQRAGLHRHVTACFVDTPIGELTGFLESLTTVRIIVAEELKEANAPCTSENDWEVIEWLRWLALGKGLRLTYSEAGVHLGLRTPPPPPRPEE